MSAPFTAITAKRSTRFVLHIIPILWVLSMGRAVAQPSERHNLRFDELASSWDEAIPLGNGLLGCLVWQKQGNLRISLDRADLWDLRPMKGLHRPEFHYDWVIGQVKKKEYKIVQEYFDSPYEKEPAPTKIPGGALEINTQGWGSVRSVNLFIEKALCEVRWENGTTLQTFVHAEQPVGWFRIKNIKGSFKPYLVPPRYEGKSVSPGGSVEGDDLSRLGYTQGSVRQRGRTITYRQPGWNGFEYAIAVTWRELPDSSVEGVWSISSHHPGKKRQINATATVSDQILKEFSKSLTTHTLWWENFWRKSSIRVPDPVLEKQWYLEQYKFGSASRRGAPPISLQAVWSADNGRIPPWKGDYHHDLNTQLSYWPCYSGNHLEEGLAYFDHLDENKANYKRYTKMFFGADGIAVPGVTTLDGTEMGGWIQYSLSPTVSAWLAHHYYLHWRYSMDRTFLRQRAYPWIKEVAEFLFDVSIIDEKGFRRLPLGASPEIHNNDITAWFDEATNYDLALMHFTYGAAAELASELNLTDEAIKWKQIRKQLPDYSLTDDHALKFAPSLPYEESHRHFSHLMAIHPLGLIRWEDGETSQRIIQSSLSQLDEIGPDWWTGYSYAWLASLKARAKDGVGASKALSIFANAFCLKNSFHVNGDQTGSGYSKFTYRPFTLEGNFAFAAGLQEMLLQSYAGYIEVMPAVPARWNDVSFETLRAEGGFLVSAEKSGGIVKYVKIASTAGGIARVRLPFERYRLVQRSNGTTVKEMDGFLEIQFAKGDTVTIGSQ